MAEIIFKELSYAITGAAMEVHKTLGAGFLESVYQTALAHEFKLQNIPFEAQVRLPVTYKNILAGDFIADFVVDHKVIVEIKGVSTLTSAHEA